MYAESVVNLRLDMAAEQLGYRPEYHSTAEVDKFEEHLRRWEKYNAAGQLYFSRNLTPQEYRFISNERILCMCDAAYFLTRYARVSDETDTSVRFRFRDTQKIYFAVVAALEEKHSAIELIIAKGRQVFVTTLTELLICHRIFFHHDTNALTASADRVKSEEMGKKILFAYDNLPWWLKPKSSRRVESVPGLLEFDTLNSRVSIQHGSGQAKVKGAQRVGLGRGGTRTVWHISEVASFPNAEEQIEAALLRGTHASPRVFGVVESTFAGDTGWFPEKYKWGKEHRDDGLSRLIPIFFSWPCARSIYPTRTWEETHPVPYEWQPEGKVLQQLTKAELFIQTDPLLSKYFGSSWEMPLIQKWFYHVGYTEAERTGTLPSWFQEMCCDDVEAMQSSYDNVFGRETIEVCHREREQKYDVYGLVGQSIEDAHEPPTNEIDYDKPRIPIRHKSHRGDVYQWELVPLRYELYEGATGRKEELDEIDGRLFIFKQPLFRQPNHAPSMQGVKQYGVGVDSSTGMGYDYSVISVTQKGDGAVPDVQAAEWRSNRVGHVEIFAFVLPICLYFTNPNSDLFSYPMVGIEQLMSVGDVCQKEMKRLGYPSGRFFHFGRYDTNKIKQETNKQGWFTTGWSRPILVGNFVHGVRNGWYVPNSPWLIESCRNFEVHYTSTGKEKLEHSSISNDDDIFAGGISTFILHDLDTLADRSKKQFRAPASSFPPIDIAPYTGNRVNVGQGRGNSSNQVSIDDILRGNVGNAAIERFMH